MLVANAGMLATLSPVPHVELKEFEQSLAVNVTVLRLLAPLKSGEVHLRATWLFTRADVVANIGVILAGVLVFLFATPYPDFVIGTLIGLYVIKEAIEILGDAHRARATSTTSP